MFNEMEMSSQLQLTTKSLSVWWHFLLSVIRFDWNGVMCHYRIWCQAISWTITDLLWAAASNRNLIQCWVEMQDNSVWKIHFKMLPANRLPCCTSLSMLWKMMECTVALFIVMASLGLFYLGLHLVSETPYRTISWNLESSAKMITSL